MRTPLCFSIATLAVAAALTACSPKVTSDPAEHPAAAATPAGTEIDKAISTYVADAAQAGMYEVQAAEIAMKRSKVAEVQAFAKTMLDYHTGTNAELKTLAEATVVSLPTALDSKHAGMIEELNKASDADFDDKYIDFETEVLENTLSAHKKYAQNGDSKNLKEFADTVWPNAEMYVKQIKALDKSPADDVTH